MRLLSLLLAISLLCPISDVSATFQMGHITANEFFLELTNKLNINLLGLESYKYCTPQIAYLVEKGYITAYQADLLMKDEVSTASLIDRAFLLVEYFDRPMTKGTYESVIERVAKETGLVEQSFDFSTKLARKDATLIIDKLIRGEFERIQYSYAKLNLKYTIDNFYNMSFTLSRVIYYVNMLPDTCIIEFKKRGYTLYIVEDVEEYHPYFRKHITAFVNLSSREMFVMRGFEQDILHEFAHIMLNRFCNKYKRLKKWYESEGLKILSLNGVQFNSDVEEYFANIFSYLVKNQDDKEFILKFKEEYPVTYSFVMEVLLEGG